MSLVGYCCRPFLAPPFTGCRSGRLVVAPESTVDAATPDGSGIEIEERGSDEVTAIRGVRTAPAGTATLNPAFDVTPASLITAIVTDARVIRTDRGETPA